MSKIITTKSGHEIMIDEEDWDKVKDITWYVSHCPKTSYAMGREKGPATANRKYFLLHRVIMDVPDGMFIDHIDHNGLNNQKSNLRICTRGQNIANRNLPSNNTTGYKGIVWKEKDKRWEARVFKNRKYHYAGYFKTKEEAAIAYNQKAQELFGEYACLNIMP